MSSALANQLRAIASLDADRITSHHGAPVGKSYLFPPKVAASHDNNSIFNIAISGFEELVQVEPDMLEFGEDFFSDASRTVDRMLLTAEENERLDVKLNRCILKLGKWVSLKATSKCIEWLVRRFRIHELNVHAVIQAFLPYHDSPYFPRILSILTLSKQEPLHNALHPLQTSPQPLDRSLLIRAISPSRDPSLAALREIMALLPLAKKDGNVHRTLLNFWSATLVDFVERIRGSKKETNEELVKVLTEGFFKALEAAGSDEQMQSSALPPLLLFIRSLPLAEGPFEALFGAVDLTSSPSERAVMVLLSLLDAAPSGFAADSAVKHLRRLDSSSLGDAVVSVASRCSLARGLSFLLSAMLISPSHFRTAIEQIVGGLNMADDLVDLFATKLTQTSGQNEDAEEEKAARRILGIMRERYPNQVENAAPLSKQQRKQRKGKSVAAADTLRRADKDDVTEDEDVSPFVQVYSADVSARIRGLERLLSDTILSTADKESVGSALLARAADQDVRVLEALYSAPDKLFAIVAPGDLLQAVSPVLYDSTTSKEVVLAHLQFIATWAALGYDTQPLLEEVFKQAYFPLLLWTKSRRHTTRGVWKAILDGTVSRFDVLNGVAGLPAHSGAQDDSADSVTFSRLNGKIAARLADNLLVSANITSLLSFILQQAKSALPPARIFAHLILAHLLVKAKPDLQLALSYDVLACASGAVANDIESALNKHDQLSEGLILNVDDPTLLDKIYTKCSHGRTAVWMAEALIGTLASIRRPDSPIFWLVPGAHEDSVKQQYRRFAASLYAVVNLAGLSPGMSTNLLRALFWNLGEDALLFLASVWTESSVDIGVRCAALRHGQAFILACIGEKTRQDFQCVLPSVLAVLSDDSQELRRSAIGMIEAINKNVEEKSPRVYALERVYGSSSDHVQLLRSSDTHAYTTKLLESADDLIASASQMAIVHGRLLTAQASESKKESILRQSIVAYLVAHVCAWRSIRPRCQLLRTLGANIDKARLEALSPLLADISRESSNEYKWFTALDETDAATLSSLLFGPMDKSAVKMFSRGQADVFQSYVGILNKVASGGPWAGLRSAASSQLATYAFKQLPIMQQCDLLQAVLISMSPKEAGDYKNMKDLLPRLALEPHGKVEMLGRLKKVTRLGESTNQAKRSRASSEDEHDRLLPLILYLESRIAADAGGDETVLSAYIDLLSDLLSDTQVATSSHINHVQQTLLRLMLQTANQIQAAGTELREPLGVEVIVKLIRNSPNPRTAQDALLLLSALASLAPESVLHNIMPVFTYMGTDEIQRDDAHSIAVVEKTIESIVPVLLSSYQRRGAEGPQLVQEAKGLLKIFADMSLRLPAHRAVPFFTHLVKVMGPSTFLGPLELLLVEQRVTKGRSAAAKGTSSASLPLLMEKHFSSAERLLALADLLSESRRLRRKTSTVDQTPHFITIDSHLSEEERAGSVSILVTAFMHFFQRVLQSVQPSTADAPLLKVLAEGLLEEVSLTESGSVSPGKSKKAGKSAVAQCLRTSLDVLPAVEMVDVAAATATKGMQYWQPTLSILQDRLPLMRRDVREQVSHRLNAILEVILRELPDASDENILAISELAFAIANGNVASEDAIIAQFVPVWLKLLKYNANEKVLVALYAHIAQMPKRLGPRMIPYVKPLFGVCIHHVQQYSQSRPVVVSSALQATSSAIAALPSFLPQKELVSLVLASLEISNDAISPAVGSLLAATAKHLSADVAFPVILSIWPQVDKHSALPLQRFFKLLQRSVRRLDRNALPTAIKPLFTLYLDAFGLGQGVDAAFDQQAHHDSRDAAIDSFLELVTKLNESTFKPLLGRLHDWALVQSEEDVTGKLAVQRRATLFRILDRLLKKFRSIMLPYLDMVEEEIFRLLSDYKSGEQHDGLMWMALISLLGRSFEVDDGSFWTREKAEKLIPHMAAQLAVLPSLTGAPESKGNHLATVTSSLAAIAEAMASSESVLKALNTSILLETRSEDAATRVASITALGAVWQRKGEEMIPLVPETVAQFLSELIEDENADVEKAARNVLTTIEGLVGDLQGYLT